MLRITLFFILSLMPVFCFALTVDEAVSYALESNNNIKKQMSLVQARDLEAKNAILVYFPSIDASYGYNMFWDESPTADYDSANFNASVTLNIFNGLNDYSLYKMGRLGRDMASSQLMSANYDVILNARNAFINVLKARSDLKVAEANLELLKLQKRDAQLSADNGLIAKNDLLQVEAYLASAELQRITAASMLTISMQNLESVTNRPLAPNVELIEPLMSDIEIYDEKTMLDMMYSNRSELKYLEQSYQSSKQNETKTRSSLYPAIDLKASYTSYGEEISPFSGREVQNDSQSMVGVAASWNLLNAASSTVQAMAVKRQTQSIAYGIADTKQSMSLELRSAIEGNITSKAQLIQSEISVKHAEENYRVKKNLYDQNAATMTDLLDASVLLNQALVARSSAIYSVISSVYKLERLIESELPVKKK